MIEENDPKYSAADYRVRLFLSIDLSGSTAYKNSEAGEEREHASPKWVTTFETFYRDFPAMFRTAYSGLKNVQSGDDSCPELWKAVGDELVFCGRVNNRKSIMTATMAFIQTLHDYRRVLVHANITLNLKGSAWLAAFPEPNRAVQLRNSSGIESYLTASEALENAADVTPFEYDFLGKAIDTGFRVASFSSPERFSLSVQLARLLVDCDPGTGFDYLVRFDRPIELKGVNNGEPYPVLYIDTMTHLPIEVVRLKERQLLRSADAPSKSDLSNYLSAYCNVVGTEEICLPMSATDNLVEPPKSYALHKGKISEHLDLERGRDAKAAVETEFEKTEGSQAPVGDISESDDLSPLD